MQIQSNYNSTCIRCGTIGSLEPYKISYVTSKLHPRLTRASYSEVFTSERKIPVCKDCRKLFYRFDAHHSGIGLGGACAFLCYVIPISLLISNFFYFKEDLDPFLPFIYFSIILGTIALLFGIYQKIKTIKSKSDDPKNYAKFLSHSNFVVRPGGSGSWIPYSLWVPAGLFSAPRIRPPDTSDPFKCPHCGGRYEIGDEKCSSCGKRRKFV